MCELSRINYISSANGYLYKDIATPPSRPTYWSTHLSHSPWRWWVHCKLKVQIWILLLAIALHRFRMHCWCSGATVTKSVRLLQDKLQEVHMCTEHLVHNKDLKITKEFLDIYKTEHTESQPTPQTRVHHTSCWQPIQKKNRFVNMFWFPTNVWMPEICCK